MVVTINREAGEQILVLVEKKGETGESRRQVDLSVGGLRQKLENLLLGRDHEEYSSESIIAAGSVIRYFLESQRKDPRFNRLV